MAVTEHRERDVEPPGTPPEEARDIQSYMLIGAVLAILVFLGASFYGSKPPEPNSSPLVQLRRDKVSPALLCRRNGEAVKVRNGPQLSGPSFECSVSALKLVQSGFE